MRNFILGTTLYWACATLFVIGCQHSTALWAGRIGDSVGTAIIAAMFGYGTWLQWKMWRDEVA